MGLENERASYGAAGFREGSGTSAGPLSSERGTNMPVTTTIWPWLAPFSVPKSSKPFNPFPPRSAGAGVSSVDSCVRVE